MLKFIQKTNHYQRFYQITNTQTSEFGNTFPKLWWQNNYPTTRTCLVPIPISFIWGLNLSVFRSTQFFGAYLFFTNEIHHTFLLFPFKSTSKNVIPPIKFLDLTKCLLQLYYQNTCKHYTLKKEVTVKYKKNRLSNSLMGSNIKVQKLKNQKNAWPIFTSTPKSRLSF